MSYDPNAAAAPQGGYQPTQEDPGKTMGILALVFAFIFSPVGIILGYLSRKKSREAGFADNTLGKWGFILGIIFFVLGLVINIINFAVIIPQMSSM